MNKVIDRVNKSGQLYMLVTSPFYASCTLNCTFCCFSNTLRERVDIKSYEKSLENCIGWLNKNLDNINPNTKIISGLVGGEIFDYPEEYYTFYQQAISRVSDAISGHNGEKFFYFGSNLVISDESIEKLISVYLFTKHNTTLKPALQTSFDFCDRFHTDDILHRWVRALMYVQERLGDKIYVELVMTQPSLECYINDDKPEFNEVFDRIMSAEDKFNISFNEFTLNDKKNVHLIPDPNTMYLFYKKIKEQYPTHHILHQFTHKEKAPMHTECGAIIFTDADDNDGIFLSSGCQSKVYLNKGAINPETDCEEGMPEDCVYCVDSPGVVDDFMNDTFGCVYCPNKPYCTPDCYAHLMLKLHPKTTCWQKAVWTLFE